MLESILSLFWSACMWIAWGEFWMMQHPEVSGPSALALFGLLILWESRLSIQFWYERRQRRKRREEMRAAYHRARF